jgi:hypothetical protein
VRNSDNNNNNNNNNSGREVGQDKVRNKINEDLQIMWHKMRLLRTSQKASLPKLKENSKLIKLEDEIKGTIDRPARSESLYRTSYPSPRNI